MLKFLGARRSRWSVFCGSRVCGLRILGAAVFRFFLGSLLRPASGSGRQFPFPAGVSAIFNAQWSLGYRRADADWRPTLRFVFALYPVLEGGGEGSLGSPVPGVGPLFLT